MQARSVAVVIQALNSSGVRYLVAGGLAVVAHGHLRFTADVDLILDLEQDNLRRAIDALGSLGYTPRAPVPLEAFADPEARAEWVRDKGLTVFSLWSDRHRSTELDIFVEPPLDFDAAYSRAFRLEVAPGVLGLFVGRDDLIELKKRAGRTVDLEDIAQLNELRGDRDD